MSKIQILNKIQKELLIGGIHTTAAILDAIAMKRTGHHLKELLKEYPGVALLGIGIGTMYFRFVTKIIERRS